MSKHVTFDETSLLKSTVSQRIERTKTKNNLQQVEVNATPLPLVGSVSMKTSPNVTPSEDQVASSDAE